MATYDLTSSVPSSSSLAAGDILNCGYSGSYITITLPAGSYTLEAWGASGGQYNSTAGTPGNGGYSTGDIILTEDTTLYLYAGGQGTAGSSTSSTSHSGGFNGGGVAYSRAGSGGGGSDIRIGSTSLYARVLVAGGGGGAPYSGGKAAYAVVTGGAGGGESGGIGGYGSSNQQTGNYIGNPGTQTAAGANSSSPGTGATSASFGEGADSYYYSSNYASGGGGGGWYGGGVGRYYYAGGGGGSGYVYSEATASNYPSGCLLNSDYYLVNTQTIIGSQAFLGTGGSMETGHSGNGYIRITIISLGTIETYTVTSTLNSENYSINPVGAQDIIEHTTYNLYITGDNLENVKITDNGVDVTENAIIHQEDINETLGFVVSGWDEDDYSYSSMSNISNAYSSYASSNYATMTLNTGSNAESWVYLTFDTSAIPLNATINSVTSNTRAGISSTSNMSTYTAQLFSGSTSKSDAETIATTSSTQDIEFTVSSFTRAELEDIKIKFYAQRGTSSTTSERTINIYGGNIAVEYTIENGNTYLLYSLADVSGDHTIIVYELETNKVKLKVNGAWVEVTHIYKKINGAWVESDYTELPGASAIYIKRN